MRPDYLSTLSPIVALSVGVAVTTSLQTNIAERLAWLEYVLQTVNLNVGRSRALSLTGRRKR